MPEMGLIKRFAVGLALLVAVGCGGQKAAPRPNIVFALADDWGWPDAGVYGDQVVQTPTFDRLARDGVLFDNAYISSPSCTPSRGAAITGQDFWRLDAGANLHSVWPSKFSEYPKMLAEAGYYVGSFRKGWGPGKHPGSPDNPAGKKYDTVDDFFAARPQGKPFCLWFGTSDPHRPYKKGAGAASGMDLSKVHMWPHYPDAKEVRGDIADYYWEVQRWDREVGELLTRVERMGELENTLILMTGDHGMPFPRGKGNLYDSGTRVPLAAMWLARVPGGRTVTDFVSFTDFAPTFLDAAGLNVPAEMTGRSLLHLLLSGKSGRVEPARDHVFFGRERHVPGQEKPDMGGYPSRAIRTDDYLYIKNFRPDRWPAGTPNYDLATIKNAWLADCDNGPTKTYLWEHRNDPAVKKYYDLAFGKRPAEELYDLTKDSGQMVNVAADPAYANIKRELAKRLMDELKATGDRRVTGSGDFYDQQEYLGGAPKWPGAK